jgi:hypothetical protein
MLGLKILTHRKGKRKSRKFGNLNALSIRGKKEEFPIKIVTWVA